MAQAPASSKGTARRRGRGFQPAASLLADRVQKAAEGRGFAVARLLTHWPEIAGERLAAVTRPVRISHARGGFGATLTLLTSGPMAPMVEMQLPQLRERVNACYGYNAIQRITLTQTAAQGFAAMQFNFVVSTNADAVHLWQKAGFSVVGRLPGAFLHPHEGPVDALVMFQTLKGETHGI